MKEITKTRLKEFRDSLNLTQDEMAKRLGILQGSWGHLESGRNSLSGKVIDRLIEEFPTINLNYFYKDSVKTPFYPNASEEKAYTQEDLISILQETGPEPEGKHLRAYVQISTEIIREKEKLRDYIEKNGSFSSDKARLRGLVLPAVFQAIG